MKPLRLLLVLLIFLLSFLYVPGQGNKQGSTNPFGDKKNSFTFMENGYYNNSKFFDNGTQTSKYNSLGVDLEWNRWFKGGFGAGLGLTYQSSGQHPTNSNNDQLNRA